MNAVQSLLKNIGLVSRLILKKIENSTPQINKISRTVRRIASTKIGRECKLKQYIPQKTVFRNTLSANGSNNSPKRETQPNFLAKYPSKKSESPAKTSATAAKRTFPLFR